MEQYNTWRTRRACFSSFEEKNVTDGSDSDFFQKEKEAGRVVGRVGLITYVFVCLFRTTNHELPRFGFACSHPIGVTKHVQALFFSFFFSDIYAADAKFVSRSVQITCIFILPPSPIFSSFWESVSLFK